MFNSFDLINKLYFVRTGGSKEERKASEIILNECKKIGVEAFREDFKVDGYIIKNASLVFDNEYEVECSGVGMSGSTDINGFEGEFVYVDSLASLEVMDVYGKICLVHSKLVNYKLYKRLVEKNAKALVLCTGDIYLDSEYVDLDPYMYRDRHYINGKIPAVCIRMKDADKVIKSNYKRCKIINEEEELQNDSCNVIATIEGSKYKDEVIVFTAHYDSVSYSKGAYDNATGSAAILELLHYFNENKPLRTLKFIWCGSEEMGLLGSKAYTSMHEEELKNYKLCINIDMVGVTIGNDIACCTSNISLVNYIKYLAAEVGFGITPRQGVYSSDSTPFSDKGVPSVSFARIAPQGGARIHSNKDILDYLDESTYLRTVSFIKEFSNRLINSYYVPVEKEIPDNMKLELDYYLGRKERKD